jgi:hypothetical protein
MRAIIVDDKDCRALVEKLELGKMQYEKLGVFDPTVAGQNITERNHCKAVVDAVHSKFHYIVIRWLQDQGWRSH